VQENVWFSKTFTKFSDSVDLLPVDHHMLAGLIAPRALFVIENSGYPWLSPWSSYGCMKAAHKVWSALGIPDRMGFSQLGNHVHCQFPPTQKPYLNAYINRFLLDLPANTTIFHTDLNRKFNERQWFNYPVPKLYGSPKPAYVEEYPLGS